MIKKAEIITILAVFLFVYITDSAKAEITDVEITPEEPTMEDIITIDTSGIETSGPVTVIDSVVNIIDTEIGLDLTFEVGPYAVMTPWSYSEGIGILPAGTYDLTVRTIVSSVVTDTYFKTFQVVPEHAMTLDGSGTEEDPWLIQSLEDFNDFAADANYWDDYTRLETDVNLAGRIYERAVIAPYYSPFTGIFDGNDHKVMNITIEDGNNYLGLFGRIDGGKVGKLALEGGSVSGDWYVGGLVGINDVYGSISDCYFTGDVHGFNGIGGLVGLNHGSVSNCYATGSVRGVWAVGGLVGLAGGRPAGNVSYCYSTGYVTGEFSVGGLVGAIWEGPVSNCYATGDVNGVVYVGGLVGENAYGSVSNCYSTGDVSGRDGNVGGLVGYNREGTVSNCYATGDVNGVGYVGGLIGYNYAEIGFSFWDTDTQTHGVTESIVLNEGTVTNVEGLPTAQMQTRSTFTDADWDFINVWEIGENQTYPYLRVYLAGDINKDGIVNFLDVAITANQWMQEQ